MTRIRQVPVLDVNQRERALAQTSSYPTYQSNPPYQRNVPMSAPMNGATNRNNNYYRPRRQPTIPVFQKFRLSDTPDLITNGCNSIREFCSSVQSITVDLNNLLGSVESIVPLLTTYLNAVQTRNAINQEQQNSAVYTPPIEVPTSTNHVPTAPPVQPTPVNQNKMPISNGPRPEDIQQLLDNPLVKNILTSFIQGNNANHTNPSNQ